jgi:hypothetical protein
MGRLITYIFGIACAILVYGYWDATRQTSADGKLRAKVATAWEMYFDSYETYGQIENGQLFLKVTWEQPDEMRRISSIHVRGTILDGDETVETVDAPCERAGSDWLGDGKWTLHGNVNTDLVCFIKLDKVLAPTSSAGLVNMDDASAGIANMTVKYTATVKAVNKPMRFVAWINEKASNSYEAVKGAILAPFQRE